MERRRFLGVLAGGGIAFGSAGCASVVAVTVPRSGNVLRVRITDHPELTRPGGAVRIRDGATGSSLYLLEGGDGAFTALSPICTHQGCTVDVAGRHLVCPCHGSTYERSGDVVRGPAVEPLLRFPVRTTGEGVLEIIVEDA